MADERIRRLEIDAENSPILQTILKAERCRAGRCCAHSQPLTELQTQEFEQREAELLSQLAEHYVCESESRDILVRMEITTFPEYPNEGLVGPPCGSVTVHAAFAKRMELPNGRVAFVAFVAFGRTTHV